jgi:hypothetical protein
MTSPFAAATRASNHESSPPSAVPPQSTPSSSRLALEITPGFVVPPDLALWRQRLFQFNEGEVITFSAEQWKQYWPFMTNIWTRHTSPYTPKRKQTVRTHWKCRLYKENPEKSLATGKRVKSVRGAIGCPARLTELHDILSDRRDFTMTGHHNHSLTELDTTKINEGIQSWVEAQLLQGFSPTAIEKVAKGKGKDLLASQNLVDAGGRNLGAKYVRNTASRLSLRTPKLRHVTGKVPSESQAREALEWLQAHHQDWHSAYLETNYKGAPSPGLVFARRRTIQTLRERGILTLMGSAHNTNQGEW